MRRVSTCWQKRQSGIAWWRALKANIAQRMAHCFPNAAWWFSFFKGYSVFFLELLLLERMFSRLSREDSRLGNGMFSVVIWLLLRSVGSQYQTGIMGKGINAKNLRIFPFSFLLHFCLLYSRLPFGKKKKWLWAGNMFYEIYGGKWCQMSLAASVSFIQNVLQSFSLAWDMLFLMVASKS